MSCMPWTRNNQYLFYSDGGFLNVKKYLREGFEGMRDRVLEWENQKQPNNQLDLFTWLKEPEFEQSSLLADEGFNYDEEK